MFHNNSAIPLFEDGKKMWEIIDFPLAERSYPHTAVLINTLRRMYMNGKVVFHTFSSPQHPVFEWYAFRRQFHEMGFLGQFWLRPTPKRILQIEPDDLNYFSHEVFGGISPFTLGGELAGQLYWGGAYERFVQEAAVAKRMGEAMADELIQDRFENINVYHTTTAWADFFYDVAWDFTYVVIDRGQKLIHVLLSTDTD